MRSWWEGTREKTEQSPWFWSKTAERSRPLSDSPLSTLSLLPGPSSTHSLTLVGSRQGPSHEEILS